MGQVILKKRLENMRGATLEVAMIADVSDVYSVISNVYCLWMYLALIGQKR